MLPLVGKKITVVVTFWLCHDCDTCPVNLWRLCGAWLLTWRLTWHLHSFQILNRSV